jgi:hypothetical protein
MNIYIQDATGKRGFCTNVTERWAQGEQRNIMRHFDRIRKREPGYAAYGYDPVTLQYVEERDVFGDGPETPRVFTAIEAEALDAISIEDILEELEAA